MTAVPPQELLLGGNQLGDQAVRELAAAISSSTAAATAPGGSSGGLQLLAVLHLHDNPRLAADGVAGLAAALPGLPSLTELALGRCHAGNEGARHLSKVRGSAAVIAGVQAAWY